MDVRRYVATSVAEGLSVVRQELGPEAVIHSVKESRDPGSRRRTVEILAGTSEKAEEPALPPRFDEQALLASIYQEQAKRKEEPAATGRGERRIALEPRLNPEPRMKPAPRMMEEAPRLGRMDSVSDFELDEPEPPRIQMPRSPLNQGILPPTVTSLYLYLVETGIAPDIAAEMVERLTSKMSNRKGWPKERIREFLSSLVTREIRVGGSLTNTKKRRIAALIGPTGVGKTTTIAKLATQLVRNKMSVGLITVDHFRVGAVDQLRKFSTTLQVPMLAAGNRRDFAQALSAFRSKNVVLIDTAGQNPRDLDILDRLQQTLGAGEGIERHLVMAAPIKERDLLTFIDIYRRVGFDYLLFTKLDETLTYGGLLNGYFAAGRPLSYFTTGQRVPEDLEAATTQRLNGLLFH